MKTIKSTIMKANNNKAEYLNEMAKAWGTDEKMMLYFGKKLSNCYKLTSGKMFPFDKKSIKKDFCFGYSDSAYDTEDFDRANRLAEKANKDEAYFINENLKEFTALLNGLKNETERPKDVYLLRQSYYGEKSLLNLYKPIFLTLYDYESQRPEAKTQIIKATAEEIQELIKVVSEEKEIHTKKINTYLKKYGLTKVNSWSYWRDE